jgi:hypothetical protein
LLLEKRAEIKGDATKLAILQPSHTHRLPIRRAHEYG